MGVKLWEDLKNQSKLIDVRKIASWLISNDPERYKEAPLEPGGKNKVTRCNIFFTDMVQQKKLPGPYHWVDVKGNPMRWSPGVQKIGREMSANDIIDWFRIHGYNYGWVKVNQYAALEFAKEGRLVAAAYHSGTNAKSGHLAVLLADGSIAQAGKGIPFIGLPIEFGFGSISPEYWANVEHE